MTRSLEGRTIAFLEGRQQDDLAELLEKEGATPYPCPIVRMIDAPDRAPVEEWIRECIDGRFRHVVLSTGEGVRRLVGFASRAGLDQAFIEALGRVRTITRGPKPVRALREIGLSATRMSEAPTTVGVIAALAKEDLAGATVGVQLSGEPNLPLVDCLEKAAARVRLVLPYLYETAAAGAEVRRLLAQAAAGRIDVLVFTSTPHVERLLQLIEQEAMEELWRLALGRMKLAAVGPIVVESLRKRGLPVHICPEQGFVMKNLVRQIARAYGKAEG
jgi:uroporphyrinogen-III synthase